MAGLRLWRLGRFGAGEGDRVGTAEGAFDQPLVEADGEFPSTTSTTAATTWRATWASTRLPCWSVMDESTS